VTGLPRSRTHSRPTRASMPRTAPSTAAQSRRSSRRRARRGATARRPSS
jgi:hypothetical protein